MKYKCNICKREITLLKSTIIIKDGEWLIKEADCCNKQMKQMTKNIGMPTIIRNEN